MDTRPLTPRQQQIFEFIKDYIKKNNYAPVYSEISEAVGLSSSATIYNHIQALQKKGYINRQKGVNRGITLLKTKEAVKEETIKIPVLGIITGEDPLEEYKENKDKTITVLRKYLPEIDYETTFILKVKGENLLSEGFLEGDFVVLEYTEEVSSQETALVVLKNNVATFRKVKKKNSSFVLKSISDERQSFVTNFASIQGRVLYVFRFHSSIARL